MKYILVSGGGISGIGKGKLSSSIGAILQSFGYAVTFLKIDPYLNYNAGKLEPSEHGETYVLSDGTEADLDLGNYERFCNLVLNGSNTITSGKVLYDMIHAEKSGLHNSGTLVFNNLFNGYIRDHLIKLSESPVCITTDGREVLQRPDFVIIELGGTIGDDESVFFLRAISRFFGELAPSDKCALSVQFPIEMGETTKLRLVLQSLNAIRLFGIHNDIVVYRGSRPMSDEDLKRISLNCGISKSDVIWSRTCENAYEIPNSYLQAGLYELLKQKLCLDDRKQVYSLLDKFRTVTQVYSRSRKIGILTRYRKQDDAYVSVKDALINAGKYAECEISIVFIDYIKLSKDDIETFSLLKSVDGILLPGGFGSMSIDTKVMVAQYARVNNIPFLGICLGFQIQMIEFARNVLNIKDATSEEFDPSGHSLVITKHSPSTSSADSDGTFLGEYPVEFSGQMESQIYKSQKAGQIFRHGYSLNIRYAKAMEDAGMSFVGRSSDNRIVAAMIESHGFYVGVQYHPELSSRPEAVDPVIQSFVRTVANQN